MGRREIRPTEDQRRSVMTSKAAGMANQDIAAAIGIDEKTLAKHYARELLHGPTIIRQELLAAVTKAAMAGKKTAITLLERMTREDRRLAARRLIGGA
jgi:hypothetical protein